MTNNSVQKIPLHYFLEFGAAMILYTVVLLATVSARGQVSPDWLAIVVELLPVLPLCLAFWAIVRQYKRFDELMQRIQSEALALGAIILGFAATIWGFAENAGAPPLPTIWVGPALIGLWGICVPFIARKY